MSFIGGLIQEQQDAIATKYCWAAFAAILYYDYFLTLPDEVRYGWKGKKSWIFVIFILSRYLPMAYFIWGIAVNLSWVYTDDMCGCVLNERSTDTHIHTKNVFIGVLFAVWCTLIAQTILNARVYALTMKSKTVAGFFVCMSVVQLMLGVCLTVSVLKTPDHTPPPLSTHLAAYRLCTAEGNRGVAVAYTAVSLCYDILMFLVVIKHTMPRTLEDFRVSYLPRKIAQDATLYFLMIFTSHVAFEVSLLLVRPSLRLLPGLGSYVLPPIMINRLLLSLRKAARESEAGWTLMGLGGGLNLEHGHHTSTHPTPEAQFASVSDDGIPSPTTGDIPMRNISAARHTPASENAPTTVASP